MKSIIERRRPARQSDPKRKRPAVSLVLTCLVLTLSSAHIVSAEPKGKILLIGGSWPGNPGSHDFAHGVQFIESAISHSPEFESHGNLVVEAYPYSWPEAGAFEDAATLVFYFSGDQLHPLLDPVKRRVVEPLMERGVGLVALHQAFTLPPDDRSVPLREWLGGARYGKADRTNMPAELVVSSPGHPLSSGLKAFVHHDEFYPTISFNKDSGTLIPIWTATLPIHYRAGKATSDKSAPYTVAWAFERDNGGRSFAYSGGHFLEGWDNPPARKLLLNAILWTAGGQVPATGATTSAAPDLAETLAFPGKDLGQLKKAVVTRSAQNEVVVFPWGKIEWHVSGPQGNSSSLTTGIATVSAGQSNPLHFHPNCDEVLHVLKGKIRHVMDEVTVEMNAGDTVSIPRDVHHRAVNIGNEDAVLAISFSTAWREVVGE